MFTALPAIMTALANDVIAERRADADRVRLLALARPRRGLGERLGAMFASGGAGARTVRPTDDVTTAGGACCAPGAA
jgi:hypothetical protein